MIFYDILTPFSHQHPSQCILRQDLTRTFCFLITAWKQATTEPGEPRAAEPPAAEPPAAEPVATAEPATAEPATAAPVAAEPAPAIKKEDTSEDYGQKKEVVRTEFFENDQFKFWYQSDQKLGVDCKGRKRIIDRYTTFAIITGAAVEPESLGEASEAKAISWAPTKNQKVSTADGKVLTMHQLVTESEATSVHGKGPADGNWFKRKSRHLFWPKDDKKIEFFEQFLASDLLSNHFIVEKSAEGALQPTAIKFFTNAKTTAKEKSCYLEGQAQEDPENEEKNDEEDRLGA